MTVCSVMYRRRLSWNTVCRMDK